jgi:serine/threonine protein kinase
MVAVKLIHPHLSVDPNFIERFKSEATAVARLRHPNIVQVHDFNIDGETYYMVMEYLVGETLQARLKRLNTAQRYMPYPEVIDVCSQVCDAVGYAHNHELIHRDIKPANIMLDLNKQAILMDFGIVKIVGGEYHTATGATIGTAMYMSPEQIRSEKADERSDIYSLGVTLFEMLSGRPPYQADSTVTLAMMVLNDPLPDLRELRENIPENLRAVAEKALAKDKKDRFQTVEEMVAGLQKSQDQAARVVPVPTVVDEEIIPAESSSTGIRDIRGVPTEMESAPGTVQEETKVDSRDAAALPTEVDQLQVLDSAAAQAAPETDRGTAGNNTRRIIIIAAALLLIGALIVGGYYFITLQRAPDLQLAPIYASQGPINTQTAASVVSLGVWETHAMIEELAFSPDGGLIGTANNRETFSFSPYDFYGSVFNLVNGSLEHHLTGHTQWVNGAAFSPDGQLLATSSDDASVRLWQVSTWEVNQKIETSSSGFTSADFSPNNLLLATGAWNGEVGVWQLSDGHLLRTLSGHEDSVRDVAFSPDGVLLATASDDSTLRLWQVSNGQLLHTLQGHTGPVNKLAISPDGSLLASAGDDRTARIWQVNSGDLVGTLQGHSEQVFDVAFSADGSLLVSGSGDGTMRFWRVSDGELLRILTEHDETITSLAFSPGGLILASGATDGVIRFWGLSEAIPVETGAPGGSP